MMTRCRILEAEAALNTTGSTSGNTDVDVNKGGASIMAAQALRIAQGSATKFVKAKPSVGVVGEPAGVPCEVGDVITVDVDAIPGTTSKDLTVRLLCMAVDV
ncbi:MAG TPA: hypothetical protein VN538_01290 [Clostridia bacterium]|nr:hypothetical protein [Clostridia bacterium]